MKKIYAIITAIFITSFSFAQHHSVSLLMGASVPLAEYASDGDDGTAGYALPSFALSFEGNYSLSPYLSLSGIANYGMNGVSAEELKNDLINDLKELYPLFTLPADAEVTYLISQWNYVNLMLGPTICLPVSRFIFQVRAMAGMSFTMPPERDLLITYTNTSLKSHGEGQSLKFGWLAGAGIIYKNNAKMGLRLGADYFSTKSVVDLNYSFDQGSGADNNKRSIEIPVTAMNITLGIVSYF